MIHNDSLMVTRFCSEFPGTAFCVPLQVAAGPRCSQISSLTVSSNSLRTVRAEVHKVEPDMAINHNNRIKI